MAELKEKYVVKLIDNTVYAGELVEHDENYVVLRDVIEVTYWKDANKLKVNTTYSPFENIKYNKIRFNRHNIIMEYYQTSERF